MTTAVLIVASFLTLVVGTGAGITFGKEDASGKGSPFSASMMIVFSLLALILAFVAGSNAG
jgi:p-aminobenzoyl-glutamate transporter AbgT